MALGLVGEIPVSTPTSVAFGKNGYLFVSSNEKPNPVVYMYKPEGSKWTVVRTFGQGHLEEPGDIMVDGDTLYVSDYKGGQILKFPLDGLTPHSVFTTLEKANGIRLGPDGNIYVTQTYTPIESFCGKGYVNVFSMDGKPVRQPFYAEGAFGLAFTSAGKLLVADWHSSLSGVGIREYTPEGQLLDRWGGTFARAVFGICTNGDNTYICTLYGNVTKYNSQHQEVATKKDLGFHLSDVEVGPDGNVYVASPMKNCVQVLSQ